MSSLPAAPAPSTPIASFVTFCRLTPVAARSIVQGIQAAIFRSAAAPL